ncbi:hypothetical protein [Halobacterium litoreum]|uniref:Right-handed parallel beta-helix repeat-containing protein n=1 Tax=Halobacterium litoreum TaxID=2039234 RepID=A0ABD5NC81_9EURY|nr:hypothetical protein [Halobacterium litoreum]UHH14413.1 hypothetical protein LT972_05290 [Halobacterium litoreum]
MTGRELSRRDYLGTAVGAAAGVAGLAALGDRARAADDWYAGYADDYETVVDVTEAGADDTGGESITDVLEAEAGDDTLLVFPAGEYRMDEQFRFTGFTNFGMVGDGATIVPGSIDAVDGNVVTAGEFDGAARLFRLGVVYAPGEDLLVEGFDFDFTAASTGLRAIEAYVADDMTVRDIDVVGEHDTGTFGPAMFSVTDPDGIATVEGFRAPDGAAFTEDTVGDISVGPTGILVPPSHEGKLWFRDCELGSFPDNGLYASSPNGRVVVQGGTFRNSNVSNIRLMGDYSYVLDATIVVDDLLDGHTQTGIRLDRGEHLWVYNTTIDAPVPNGPVIRVQDDATSARIQETSISVGDRPSHAITMSPDAGVVDIFDTDIEFDGAGNAVQINGHNDDSDSPVTLRRVTVTGDASGDHGRNAIRVMRQGCLLDDVVVEQPGTHYRRALELHGDDTTIDGGTYRSTHHPIVNVADGTALDGVTARSYDGYQALKLYDGYADVTVTDSELYEGIVDRGVRNLDLSGNSYPDA